MAYIVMAYNSIDLLDLVLLSGLAEVKGYFGKGKAESAVVLHEK